MEKIRVMKIANAFLFGIALVQAVTGLLIFFLNEGAFAVLMGNIHRYNGLVLVILIGIHVWLNWSVIRSHYFKSHKAT